MTMWPQVMEQFERWPGREPLGIAPGISLLAAALRDLGTTAPAELTAERWSRLVSRSTATLARLIELSTSTDATLARDARAGAALLSPLLKKMTDEVTVRLGKTWRTP